MLFAICAEAKTSDRLTLVSGLVRSERVRRTRLERTKPGRPGNERAGARRHGAYPLQFRTFLSPDRSLRSYRGYFLRLADGSFVQLLAASHKFVLAESWTQIWPFLAFHVSRSRHGLSSICVNSLTEGYHGARVGRAAESARDQRLSQIGGSSVMRSRTTRA